MRNNKKIDDHIRLEILNSYLHESQNSHSSPDISSTLEETQLIVRLPLPYLLFSINARTIVRIYACANISINDCANISICI